MIGVNSTRVFNEMAYQYCKFIKKSWWGIFLELSLKGCVILEEKRFLGEATPVVQAPAPLNFETKKLVMTKGSNFFKRKDMCKTKL